jgi:protoporphyrinogen oxidase
LLASPSWIQLAEETCDVVCSSYFGPAVAESILRPWTLRMMGSEPEEVYLGNLGPFLGKPPGKLMRLSRGMGAFLEAAAAQLNVRLRHTVTNVVIDRGRVTAVEGVDVHGRPFHERADIVVAATPAPIAADLLGGVPALAENLRGVLYRPAATVVAEYTDVAFPGDVGGLFLPRGHVAHHIARYDDANRVRFTFGGVAARRVLESDSLEQLLECGESIFGKFHGKLGRRLSFTGKRWRHGLCAHSWMHHRTLASIREQSEKIRGLVLGGDYFRGNLLESCVTAAHENVDHLVDSGRF